MKTILIFISLLFLLGCMPKIPEMKTPYGDECIAECQGSYIYNGSRQELRDCYKACAIAEEMKEKARKKWEDIRIYRGFDTKD